MRKNVNTSLQKLFDDYKNIVNTRERENGPLFPLITFFAIHLEGSKHGRLRKWLDKDEDLVYFDFDRCVVEMITGYKVGDQE